jgi:hypothetical protein
MSGWIGSQINWRNEEHMLSKLRSYTCVAVLMAGVATRGFASPAESKLLSLVPAGSEIVAGIEDPHNPGSHGRLLLVTHNNNLDFTDWVALTGVDPHRKVDEVIEVSASSSRGELKEHLLLVEGSFDKERIFHAAEYNGATEMKYKGEEVLSVKAFPREQQEMADTRWLAILDDRTAVFGTPLLIQEALNRYAEHAETDSLFAERLAQLRPDVNSWNVLVMSADMLARHVAPDNFHGPWTHILDGADELTVGIHYGSTVRVDFAAHTNKEQQPSEVAALFAQPQMVKAGLSKTLRLRLEGLTVERNRVQGSVVLPGKQFDTWLEDIYRIRAGIATPDGAKSH